MSRDLHKQIIAAARASDARNLQRLLSIEETPVNSLLEPLRAAGALRASRYKYDPTIPRLLVAHLRTLKLTSAEQEYLRSVDALLSVASAAGKAIRTFSRAINARSFKSYVVSVDEFFQLAAIADETASTDPAAMGKEEYASLLSFYYALLREQGIEPEKTDLFVLHLDKIRSQYYLGQLRLLFGPLQLREAEIHVDHFGYQAVLEGKTLKVSPPTPIFEQAYRLGYIRQEQQSMADNEKISHDLEHLPTMLQGVSQLLDVGEKLFLN